MKDFYLKLARFLSRRPYFKGRDRLTHQLLIKASQYGPHRIHINEFAFDLNLLDSLSQSLYLFQHLPGSTWKAIDLLLEPGKTMLDIGANIGYTSLIAARRVGPSGRVFAFEPSPRAYASLATNASLNKFDWLQIEALACGVENAEMILYTSSLSDEYNSLAPDQRGMLDKTVTCKVVRVDQYLLERKIAHVDLIKIDVEGAEWPVIKGMDSLLTDARSNRPMLIVEACLKNTSSFGYTPAEMFEHLADTGYQLKILTKEGSILPYDSDHVMSPEGLCDVICYDSSQQEQINKLKADLSKLQV